MSAKGNDDAVGDCEEMPASEEQVRGIRVHDIYIPPPPMPACTFDTKGPRLIITKIENINFKSYANHQDLGPFHKNFTAIVGPNGSGKSNVIDAMLFVFGYRAQKIRSKKVGVLIHSSDKYPNLQSCTVKVHFQMILDKGPHDFEVIPDSDFFIGRTAYKDNSSVYEINGRRVQFKEVSKLLRSYGIDLDHNRFLILQGEIEMIAMMKPKGSEHDCGMLEYLEDIIGCNRFIEPIEKLNVRVEELNEIRTEKLNRVKGVEKEKEDILIARNEALEYQRLENKKTLLKNIVIQLRLKDGEVELQVATESRDKHKEALNQLVVKQEEAKCSLMVQNKEYESVRIEYEKCAQFVEECKEQYSALERQDVTCRENVNHAKAKMKKLIKSLESEEEKLKDLKKQPVVHEGEASELEKKREQLEQKKESEEANLREVMKSMKEGTVGLQEEKDKHEAQLIKLKKVVNETKSKMDIAQSELDLYLSREKSELARLNDLQEKLEEAAQLMEDRKCYQEEADKKIPDAEEKLKDLKNLHLQVSEKEAKAFEEVKIKRSNLEEAKASLNANHNRGAVLQSLLDQRECGSIPGIFGRLGDLGAIAEKYDVAMSTACGSLDHIVTDTIGTAQKCVEYLKRHNKGYATFIALEKVQKWEPQMRQKFSAPENVPRLFDLIKVKDPQVLSAFYHALHDTLVTDNLEQATRIGLHGQTRYRCVTLRGEVIDLAGTMSGGGGRVLKGRMGQSVAGGSDITTKTVEKMSQELNDLMQKARNFQNQKANLEECISKTEKEIMNLRHSLKKNSQEFKAYKDSHVAFAKQVEQQKLKLLSAAPDKNKVKEMETTLQKAKKEFEKANEAASEVHSKVQSLQAEIVSITKGKYGAAQKRVDKLTKEIDTVNANITKCNAAAKAASRNMKKTEDKIKSLQAEIEEARETRENLMKEFKELEQKASTVMTKQEAASKEMSSWEEKKKELFQVIDAIKATELKLKSEHIELKNKVKAAESVVKEKLDAVKHLKAQLAKLQLQKIDDDSEEAQSLDLPVHSADELIAYSANSVVYEIGGVEAQMEKMKPNMAAIAEYRKKVELYKKKVEELEAVTKERDEMKKHHDDLRKQRLEEFMNGFKIITSKLKEVYQMITLGGDAELELVDSLDPFTEGIVFSVRPPKKSWKNITNLSGGEKTLSSLALVFALHYYKPTPFYVMDEIDAALDFKNVSIVGNYIKERTKNAQFIIISLRNNMFELSDRLVGIFKTYNCTKSATISPHELTGEEEEDTSPEPGNATTNNNAVSGSGEPGSRVV